MSSITVIPTALAQRAVVSANPRNAGTCGLYDVAGRLGQAHRAEPYICRTIDALITEEGFPAPFPLPRGGTVVKTAHRQSRWPTVAVDAWFENRLPPAARRAVDQAERAEIDSRLSTRARLLFADADLGDAA